jgi:hypothetical protein
MLPTTLFSRVPVITVASWLANGAGVAAKVRVAAEAEPTENTATAAEAKIVRIMSSTLFTKIVLLIFICHDFAHRASFLKVTG